jgi:PPOX class probable F420-dependent enzyme
MAAETELWELIASRREGVLGTIKRGGLPQLSNVLYLPEPGGRTVRISTTADRLKARVLARDPRAVLHVTGDNFWAYAVAEGHATLTPAAADPGDEACRALLEVHSAFYGPQDQDAFFTEMIARRRLVIRLSLDRVYGVIATGGRRPLPVSGSAPRLPGRSDADADRVRLAGGQPGQQRDAGAPVTAVEAAGDEPGSFEAVEQQGQRRLVHAERPPERLLGLPRADAESGEHNPVAESASPCARATWSSAARRHWLRRQACGSCVPDSAGQGRPRRQPAAPSKAAAPAPRQDHLYPRPGHRAGDHRP